MRLLLTGLTLAASIVWGQTTREFQVTQKQTPEDLAEIATMLRATAGIAKVSVDETKRSLTATGSPEDLALAGWLVQQLGPGTPGIHEYRAPGGGDDVTRVFYVQHADTTQDLQELVTTIRSVADVRRLFVYTPGKAVTARGTRQQIQLSAWLLEQLDQAAHSAAPAPHEYTLPGDDVARVFELTYPETPQDLQEVVTLLRSVADIQRAFVYNTRRSIAVRAPAERVALASWLVGELDKPSHEGTTPDSYSALSGPLNLVRIYYLPGSLAPAGRQKVVAQVRANAGITHLFVYNKLGALAVRGTVSQVETAQKAMEEMQTP